jgi:class 3 adenylate cyclase
MEHEQGTASRRVLDSAIGVATRLSPRRVARSISLTSWLAVVVLTITVISLVVVSVVSLSQGSGLAQEIVEQRLSALRSLKASEVELYLNTTMSQTLALASSEMTADATLRFTAAYGAVGPADPSSAEDVISFYRDEFVPDLEAATGATIGWQDLVPTTSSAIHLQRAYVTDVDGEADDRRLVDDAGDGSAWSVVHRDLHPRFVDIADRLDIEDLYIVDPATGNIVYSTAKAPDFATSLDRGPYSASSLATLIRTIRNSPDMETAMAADLTPYAPALGEPVGFFAAPIVASGDLIGVLALRIPIDQLNLIMTSDEGWESEGFGDTGETFLVGADGRMRSVSRRFLEDPSDYFDDVAEARSLSEAEQTNVRALDTTVTFQQAADLDVLERVDAGNREIVERVNYLGREVLAAYEPIDVDSLAWFVAVEVERDEATRAIVEFRRLILIVVSVFVLVITFVTVAWARRALDPVRAISERLTRALRGEPPGSRPAPAGPLEMAELNDDVARITDLAALRRAQVEAAVATKHDTLRELLPETIVQRLEVGDRLVVEQVFQASVVVILLDDLGSLIRPDDVAGSRTALDRVVDALDSAASEHGLERVKVIGNLYYAGSGLSHPYLDHAPRALDFAVDARQRLSGLGLELGVPVSLGAGIDSGPVSVGLSGSSRLTYDVWGETVSIAAALAHRAEPGDVLVSDRTWELLPHDTVVGRSDDRGDLDAWSVSARPGTEVGGS